MKILCAGPTSIDKRVLDKMSLSLTNPDLDPNYKDFYKSVEEKYKKLINTKATSFFILGEAIITLEASICSLMEKGERVLVIYNGFFGEGFREYIENFGGEAITFKGDFRRGINLSDLKNFLERDHDFTLATMVHCETPSGLTNDIKSICSLLKSYGILSIVDSVSGVGGEYVDFDDFNIDVLLSGSQKCISAPTGIGMVTLSEAAKEKISKRKSRIPSYYLNFKYYYDSDLAPFPYTVNENLIYALDEALNQLLDKDFVNLHKKYAEISRRSLESCGFVLYAKDHRSNTVTTVINPEGLDKSETLLENLREKGLAISKGVGEITEKVFRIGHMGHNISYDNFLFLFKSLDQAFKELNIKIEGSLEESFKREFENYKEEI